MIFFAILKDDHTVKKNEMLRESAIRNSRQSSESDVESQQSRNPGENDGDAFVAVGSHQSRNARAGLEVREGLEKDAFVAVAELASILKECEHALGDAGSKL